ncbi:MAG: DUF1127 domain-containing protein [Roseiarcus sp.]|uniref:DUF1127 domain-containing protein n=1 Tax=Roseiarcus sp. TaxID=1969460 RepID=UPI003C1E333A
MKMLSLARYFRRRLRYWTIFEELSRYSNQELHDIGIDAADIPEIARRASEEQQ